MFLRRIYNKILYSVFERFDFWLHIEFLWSHLINESWISGRGLAVLHLFMIGTLTPNNFDFITSTSDQKCLQTSCYIVYCNVTYGFVYFRADSGIGPSSRSLLSSPLPSGSVPGNPCSSSRIQCVRFPNGSIFLDVLTLVHPKFLRHQYV